MCEPRLYMTAGCPDVSFTHGLITRASLMVLQNFMWDYICRKQSLSKEQRSNLRSRMCQCLVCNVDC